MEQKAQGGILSRMVGLSRRQECFEVCAGCHPADFPAKNVSGGEKNCILSNVAVSSRFRSNLSSRIKPLALAIFVFFCHPFRTCPTMSLCRTCSMVRMVGPPWSAPLPVPAGFALPFSTSRPPALAALMSIGSASPQCI